MKLFRIKIYLKLLVFFKSIFKKNFNFNPIDKLILKTSKKRYLTYTSQLRTGFLLVLLYLKSKFKKKNEIIMMSYNLKEMVNIPSKLKLKVVFCDISLDNGSISFNELKKKINKKTLCVVLTNIFSDFKTCKNLKTFCKKRKIPLIEDNAIYFDNYSQNKAKIFNNDVFKIIKR